MQSPSHYADLAVQYMALGNIELAIAYLNSARSASIGHSRRARYKRLADELAEKHDVERHQRTAKDYCDEK